MRTYQSPAADSRRWEGFEHRDGDIVISTPSKCGTTWTQMLVALLVFDGPDLPDRLGVVSPWLDAEFTPLPVLHERLAAQRHRRFIKTHVPLDGLPLDDRVTYVVVGRDPRDVWLSMQGHRDNTDYDQVLPALAASIGADELQRRAATAPSYDTFGEGVAAPVGTCQTSVHPAFVLHHLNVAWERRDDAGVVLLHYADLQADLVGELARLARALGFDLDDDRIRALAAHAGIDRMRARADDLAPETDHPMWKRGADFFRSGRMGEWATAFSPDDLRAYDARARQLHPDEAFLSWAHGGRRAAPI
ncbi:sulfotransferase domain-containing protein [Nocardioides humilatus]|uniref:Sulfotransferase domain-containing protein n=1 Tax=Nocardioides humilatus TaxID=2607660 RepID=A0A5B1LPY0_9ACTN|nr:sulfotransferase domain-containing protein [Nocardioides humilatus]KAA1421719.1 sulfotransferase domain-containing protein [Nocardioides humilatus]